MVLGKYHSLSKSVRLPRYIKNTITYHISGTLCCCHSIVQLRPTLCDPIDYRSHQAPLSRGILQARILEGTAISSSRGSSWHRDRPTCPTLQADSLLSEPPWAYEGFKVGPPECGGCGQIGIRKTALQVTDSPWIKPGTALPLHCLRNCFLSAWHWGGFCKWGDEWLHPTDINARMWEQK